MGQDLIDKYLRQHNIVGFSDYPGIREALMETEAFREFLWQEYLARHPIIAKILKAVGGVE